MRILYCGLLAAMLADLRERFVRHKDYDNATLDEPRTTRVLGAQVNE